MDDTLYSYRKNLFGDIVAIYQGATKVAEYAYDAYGNYTIVSDTNNIGRYNPFRYRGYYYDTDLGLYYLMSRYYDPTTGRFINADTFDYLDPKTIGGINLYTYCLNNPIMVVDPQGHLPQWAMWAIGGALLVASIVVTIATYGAASGTIVAAVHAIATSAMVTGLTSAAIGTVAGGLEYKDGEPTWSWDRAAEGFMWGSITGTISGVAGGMLSNVGSGLATLGKLGKLGYMGIQAALNSTISGALTALQGVCTNSFSWESVGISAAFGFAGGMLDSANLYGELGGILVGLGLGLSEASIGEIMDWWESKQNSAMSYLRFAY